MLKAMAMTVALVALGAVACGATQSTAAGPAPARRGVPAKCTACHLAPKEHSLAADKWPAYLKAHQRRLRLTDEEKDYLHDFLIARP
jgi:hypothetical protein